MARAPKVHIPQSGDELDADWFTEALGPASGGRVTAVRRERIGEGIGFMGELQRCHLEWDSPDRPGPTSVIVKIPTPNLANRSVGEGLGVYEREIVAYRDLSDRLGVTMPAYHHGVMDPDPAPWLEKGVLFLFEKLPVKGVNWVILQFLKLSGKSTRRYLLVIEDIADARPPQQFEGGSLADARAALTVLARFHAANWMAHDVVDVSSRMWPVDRVPKVWQASYLRNRDDFVDRFGELIGAETIARLDDAQERIPELVATLAQEPWSVLHGDYRLDNLLYRPDGELVVLDFQMLTFGRPGWDVAYFITTALHPEHHDHEAELLRHYHDALVAEGVSGYSYDDLVADTTTTKLLLAHRMVCSGDTLDTQIAGEDDTFIDLMVKRVMGWLD